MARSRRTAFTATALLMAGAVAVVLFLASPLAPFFVLALWFGGALR